MKIIKKIYDFIAKRAKNLRKRPWVFHFWKHHCWENPSRHFGEMAEVEASELEEICGYINPLYSGLVQRARDHLSSLEKEIGRQLLPATQLFEDIPSPGDHIKSFADSRLVGHFYNDQLKFLQRLQSMLISALPAPWGANTFHVLREFLIQHHSPTLKEFESKVSEHKLDGHVVWRSNTISFERIRVRGNVNLMLGGKFSRWRFNRMQFCDDAAITVYSSSHECTDGKVLFSENICCGNFSCSFACIPSIQFFLNLFMASARVGAGTHAYKKEEPVSTWVAQRADFSSTTHPTLKFSNNCAEGQVEIYNELGKHSISDLNFINGNRFGGLSCSKAIRDTHFDINERIRLPSSRAAAMRYKQYFIALKNQAIDNRDREAEFNYGRKERYFDRGVATRWQDKFPLWWSHIISDGGISWFRPAFILLAGQWILAFIFIGGFGGCGGWSIAAVESLNPLSSLDDIAKSPCCKEWIDSFSASIYNAVRRIFSLALLYEIIKVLRRFHN